MSAALGAASTRATVRLFLTSTSRHLPDAEPASGLRILLDVDANHPEAVSLFPRQVVDEAVHAPGGARPLGGEEDE